MDRVCLLELGQGCSRAICCSLVCAPLHGEQNSLYTDKSLSCLSVGFFVLKAAMVIVIHGYCWRGLLFLLIHHPRKRKLSPLSSVQDLLLTHTGWSAGAWPWLLIPHQSYLSSHFTLMSQPCFSWLSWGLSLGRHARRLNARFTAWLLDWFLRSSPKTDSVSWTLAGLNNCGFWELWGESVEKTGSSRKAKTDS